MTEREHQPRHQEPNMTQHGEEEAWRVSVILTEPEEEGHEGHPCVWLSTPSTAEDVHPDGLWVCLGHPDDRVWAAVVDVKQAGDLPQAADVQDFVGFHGWKPLPGDGLDIYLKVAQGLALHGPAFAVWADLIDDPDMMDSFTDYYTGTYRNPSAWAEDHYGDEVEDYLNHTIRPDLRRFIMFDYTTLANYAFDQGIVWFCPGEQGELHAFTMVETPR